MQKKIGIITMYHNSINYGGVLQAYALTRFLNELGYDAQQVRVIGKPGEWQRAKVLFMHGTKPAIKKVLRNARWIARKVLKKAVPSDFDSKISARRAVFAKFGEEFVPQSEEIYNSRTIKKANDNYDVFITGSDQVWNFAWYNPIYFLDFVRGDKKRIAYAASISMHSLNRMQKRITKRSLKNYDAISVREESAVGLISDLTRLKPEFVLDPTLLLSKDDWDILAKRKVECDAYVFCYFIGENKAGRRFATEFARKHGFMLVGISIYHNFDALDIKLADAGPEEFLSYLKNAKYVFTDSFHAVVFSKIFEKQYFVFNRDDQGSMNSRIHTITSLFETEDRFCYGERERLDYIESLPDIDYTKQLLKFEEKKKESIDFLLGALEE